LNALFLKDLAEKTHRGLRGRIENGEGAGGLCYGYRVVRALNGTDVTTGDREIESAEAAIVERIFRDFVAGLSPKQIVKTLNGAGVPGPSGDKWSPRDVKATMKPMSASVIKSQLEGLHTQLVLTGDSLANDVADAVATGDRD
jgi:site-specific DNA recombinase